MDISLEQRMTEGTQLIDSVMNMSKDFTGDGMPVTVDADKVKELSDNMQETGKMVFDVEDISDLSITNGILVELFASAVNYCFWYGKYDFRPTNKSSSYMLYNVIIEAVDKSFKGVVDHNFVNAIIDKFVFDRYPLLEERIKHTLEVALGTYEFIMFVHMNKDNDVRIVLHELVRRYPGFASDMFLKRAFLFVMQLNRKLNFFNDTINKIPVPSDYQVPKMLEHFECLVYSPELINKIKSHRMIPRYSIDEISIRAATVLACDRLSELTGWTKSEIDAWLWLRRKECDKPFHLTITTDY